MSNYPVDGPYRIGVTPLPGGATVDISHYLTSVILSLAEWTVEDPEGLAERLVDIHEAAAASTGADSYAAHERDALVQSLLEQAGHEGAMSVYEPGVLRLADALLKAAGRHIPGQRGEAA